MTVKALIDNSKIYYHTDVFTAKKSALILGTTLCGITLLVLGVLAHLNVGTLGSISPAGALALTNVGTALTVIGLIMLGSSMQEHRALKAHLNQQLNDPKKTQPIDVEEAQNKTGYYLIGKGDDEGLVSMNAAWGVFINAIVPNQIHLFVNEEARDAFGDQLSFTPRDWMVHVS